MLDRGSSSDRKVTSARPLLTGLIAAVALLAAAFLIWQRVTQSSGAMRFDSRSPAAQSISPDAAAANSANLLAAQVAAETAKLHVRPHTIVSTTDKAMSATEALRRGDYQAASLLAHEVLKRSKLQAFAFYPFNDFISHLSQGDDPKFLEGLDAWIAHSPKSALAHLMRASYYIDTAALIRGSDFASAVTDEHMHRFAELLGHAESDLDRALVLDPDIPTSYFLRLQIAGDGGDLRQLEQAFRDGVGRFPNYYELYELTLHFLQPKWGGSIDAMRQFVDQYAGRAPTNSPLKLLYLQLLANFLNDAWVQCSSLKHELLTACMDSRMNRYVGNSSRKELSQALNIYKHTDPVQFSTALWPILHDMVGTDDDLTTINVVLQLAAEAMGTDNQLIQGRVRNNYVLDDIAARVWVRLGNHANAEQKFAEALEDVEHMPVTNDEDKDAALAAIYDDMAWFARSTSQYAKVIAYHDAADTVAGVNHGGPQFLKCNAYYRLQQFQKTVEECTHLIDTQRDVLEARYDRAMAYEGLHKYDAALADFEPIAEDGSDNYLRDGAVIEMGHINALRGRYAAELEILNKYPFIFDASLMSADDLAVAYNNRCFAYMQLGQLQKALADCTTSLSYRRLPDAVHKEQQLMKRLGIRAVPPAPEPAPAPTRPGGIQAT